MATSGSVPEVKKSIGLPPLPKPLRRARKDLEKTAKVAKVASSASNVVALFTTLSKSVSIALKTTKVPTILLGPFFIKDCVDDVVKISTKERLQDKIRAAFTFVVNTESFVNSIAAACTFLTAVKLVGEHAIKWIPVFNIISFIVSFVSLGLSSESTEKSRKLYQLLNAAEKDLRKTDDDVEKAAILVDILCEIETIGIQEVRKKLLLSKHTNLEARIHDLVPKLLASSGRRREKALEEGKQLIQTLAGRATTDLSYNVASLANKIVAIVGSTLLFFPPAVPVGIIILAVSGVASLVLFAGKCYFVKKDPFTEGAACKAYELFERISEKLKLLRGQLETFVIGERRLNQSSRI